jgi:putative transposase
VYKREVPESRSNSARICTIDLGVNNLATLVNNAGLEPVIINGKILKSMNQYYNKEKARLVSQLKRNQRLDWSKRLGKLTDKRNNKVKDYLHKTSRYIIEYCRQNKIDTLVVGKNEGWKQEINLGKKMNQNFVGIPYVMLIGMLRYKAEEQGVRVYEVEESYTSGTSFVDGEEPIRENYDKSRRKYRGLFVSNEGVKINADVNGAYQIMKKVFPKAYATGIEGVVLHPIKAKIA